MLGKGLDYRILASGTIKNRFVRYNDFAIEDNLPHPRGDTVVWLHLKKLLPRLIRVTRIIYGFFELSVAEYSSSGEVEEAVHLYNDIDLVYITGGFV